MAATLTGESLVLNTPRHDDVDTVYAICQDPEILRWVPLPDPYDRRRAEYFIDVYVLEGITTGKRMVWAIRADAQAPLQGVIALTTASHSAADIGYWLAPSARGHGVMARSIDLVLDHAFFSIGLARVQWASVAGNTRSARLARAAGFRFEGVGRSAIVFRTERRDEWRAAVLATDDRTPQDGWPAEIDSV